MQIYFTGSIRGGREHANWYAEILTLLKSYGEVLTEHVGDKNLSEDGEGLPVEHIFERDIKWIEKCDALVADVSVPSLGVGYEIARAEALEKPVLCLFYENADKRMSGMIEGNKKINTARYKNVEEVSEILKKFFEALNI